MTVQDIDNSISASFHSLELCHTILSNSMDNLVNGQFDNEPYLFPIAGSEDEVRYRLDKNRNALEAVYIEDWFINTVSSTKLDEYTHIISASKAYNSII